ncbi:MAG: Ig-like domain-containing protein [Butyrivibrio sp.]|nr:Ig-like domain-containing protein [Butyrivibrio sp.]
MTLAEGETRKITPTVIPQDAKVTWTSADKNTATVDENGNVTGITEGNTIITGAIKVDEKEYKAECEVKVTKLPNITLDTTEMSLMVDEVRPVKATTVPGDATVAWTSADKRIATVDDKGNVTGVSEGTTTITGTITVDQKEYSAKCEVTVTKTPGITFDTKEMSLKVGEEKTIAATTVPKDAKVAWTSDDYDIAKVDENGKVTSVSE